MTSIEMELATRALAALETYGFAELRYETAQFEPYSSRNRPDIFFSPGSGPSRGLSFLVELRMPATLGRRLPTYKVLQERQIFLEDEHFGLRFGLATTRKVDDAIRLALSYSQIQLFDGIKSGEDLAARILKWSGATTHRTSTSSQGFLLPMPLRETQSNTLAHRSDSLNIQEPPLAATSVEAGRISEHNRAATSVEAERSTDEDIFRRTFGEDMSSKEATNCFLQLRGFFDDGNLGSFADRIDFLRFLKETLTEHQCTTSLVFNRENLRRSFRHFNEEDARGLKL